MKFTLNMIKERSPCTSGWKTLLKSLGKTEADSEELDLMHVLKSNGIEDAIWCLHCFDYIEYCLFLADVAESVLHIYESKNKSTAPRDAIAAIREYKVCNITLSELKDVANAAAADAAYAAHAAAAAYADHAVAHADANAAYAAYAAYAVAHADANAAHAAYAAYAAAHADANAAADAAANAAANADADTAYAAYADHAAARSAKWEEIELLFVKHFGE